MAWRLARGLDRLRSQINTRSPNRNKSSDGTIGDRAHAARASDHNPRRGIVHALDLTHDPGRGVDTWSLADRMRLSKDPRIKYVISNRRIFSSPGYTWRPYKGSNPHSRHVHISIRDNPHADQTQDWKI
jgi:hypothetical protein